MDPSPSPPPSSHPASIPRTRTSLFRAALSPPTVDLSVVKALTASGIPDEDPFIRATTWQLLLGYLPPERSQWEPVARKKELDYAQFCQDLIIDPNTLTPLHTVTSTTPSSLPGADARGLMHRTTVSVDDHPLSTSDSSKWKIFFADAEIREQIDRYVCVDVFVSLVSAQ